MILREANSDDLELLYDMLLEAFNWNGTERFTRAQIVDDPHTALFTWADGCVPGAVARARELGYRALSLSVEDGNTAARALYERQRFVVVGRNGDSDTMLRGL